MAIFPTVKGTRSFTTGNEYSIAQDATYSAGSPKTTTGYVAVWVDLTALVAGDVVEIRIYRGLNGATAAAVDTITKTAAEQWGYPLFLAGSGWDVTVKLTSATARTLSFEVIQDINDVNAATMAAAAAAAVWAAISEGAETFGDAIRLIGSRLFGKATVQDGDGAYTYRDKADSKNRIAMTRTGTARTVSTRDGT